MVGSETPKVSATSLRAIPRSTAASTLSLTVLGVTFHAPKSPMRSTDTQPAVGAALGTIADHTGIPLLQ